MPLRVRCPGCDQKFQLPDTVAGKKARCPECATVFVIPSSAPSLEESDGPDLFDDLEQDVANERPSAPAMSTAPKPRPSPAKVQVNWSRLLPLLLVLLLLVVGIVYLATRPGDTDPVTGEKPSGGTPPLSDTPDCTPVARELTDRIARQACKEGEAHMAAGRYREAIESFDRAIAREPNHAGVLLSRSACHYELRNMDKALSDASRVIELAPNCAGGYHNRGMVHAARNELDKAVVDYSRAIVLFDGKRKAELLLLRADTYSQMGKDALAMQDCRHSATLNTGYPDLPYVRGLIHWRAERWRDAITDLNRFLEREMASAQDWNYLDAVHFRAKCYAKAKQYELAERDCTWFLKQTSLPNGADDARDALRLRFLVRWHLGRRDDANRDFNRLVEQHPKDPSNYMGRAELYESEKAFDKAWADLSKALTLAPDSAKVMNNVAWFLVTCPDGTIRDPHRGLRLAQKANLLEPEDAMILDTLACAYAENGDFTKAVQIAKRALALVRDEEGRTDLTERLEGFRRKKTYLQQNPDE